jgi:hypothetical protein
MIGPGKYDDVCTIVREKTDALTAIVIILDGNKGSGFSIQTHRIGVVNVDALADMLEHIARQLREDT